VTTEADSLAAAVEAPYDYIGVKASAGVHRSPPTSRMPACACFRIYQTYLDS
jgi:hypothetical protein